VIGISNFLKYKEKSETTIFQFVLPHLHRADIVHCYQPHVRANWIAAKASRALRQRIFVSGWRIGCLGPRLDGTIVLVVVRLSADTVATISVTSAKASRVILGYRHRKVSPRRDAIVYARRILPHKGNDLIVAITPMTGLEYYRTGCRFFLICIDSDRQARDSLPRCDDSRIA
jgi:hypothetical protein